MLQEGWFGDNWMWIVPVLFWSLAWKGVALWHSAQKKDKAWFTALLVINTAGLLEMFYIFVFSKRGQS